MKKINDGGPAFPVVGENGPYGEGDFITAGMSLRDYFAAKAMQGEVCAQDSNFIWKEEKFQELARRCYAIAEAMLAAREAGK